MRTFEYHNPSRNIEREEDPLHTMELRNETGEVIAGAEIEYFSKPIPYYQITDIWVEHEESGKGIARDLMTQIEEMLKKKKRAGFLVDAIREGNPAKGMYQRRGWLPVPEGKDQFVFNLPAGVTPNVFIAVEARQRPLEDREGSEWEG